MKKSWDAIIIGGGIIGLSLAIALRKTGLCVLVVERGEPGREASSAAAGMLVGKGIEIPEALKPLAAESARLYPEFVHELRDESGLKIDFRDEGTLAISGEPDFPEGAELLAAERLHALEPALNFSQNHAAYLPERSVDPRQLVAAAIKTAHHREVDISSGNEVNAVLVSGDRVVGVQTDKARYSSAMVVNCAGAWAGSIAPCQFPVKPIKGQMLAVVGGPPLKHVIRGGEVYLVPRSDGRIVIGSTLENAGYDMRTDVDVIRKLFQAAVELVPGLANAKKHEDWAGLRPGTPDELPMLGETSTRGYFIASGHYRDGILLAPVTAQVMTDVILRRNPVFDLLAFSPARFDTPVHHGDTEPRRKVV